MTEYYADSLLKAAKAGNLDLVEESWMKAENKYETDFLGHNALTLAIIHGHFEVFEYLMNAWTNLDSVNNVHSTYMAVSGTRTALICAVRRRDFRMVECLIEKGASVNIVDQEDHIALYYALLKRCDRELIGFLIRSGSSTDLTCEQLDEYARYHENFRQYWIQIRSEIAI